MMKQGGFNTVLGGNIGNALTGEIFSQMTEQQRAENGFFRCGDFEFSA